MNSTNTPSSKNKKNVLKTLLIVLAFIGVFGGQLLGYNAILKTAIESVNDYKYGNSFFEYNEGYFFEDNFFNSNETGNNYFLRSYFELSDTSNNAITTNELETIKSRYYQDQSIVDSIASPGVYQVGTDIEPGIYYVAGDSESTYDYFVLSQSSDESSFETNTAIYFKGFSLISLHEGQIFICDNEEGFSLRDNLDLTYSSPYNSGMYEVGRDIPAGTYYIIMPTNSYAYGYYIWKDLEYSDESLIDGTYDYITDEDIKLDLEEGTYIELFDASLAKTNTRFI